MSWFRRVPRPVRTVLIALIVLAAYRYLDRPYTPGPPSPTPVGLPEAADPVAAAFQARADDIPVAYWGVVTRILSDDRDGSRHQRFLLRTSGGGSVLVAHNIDLAPRLAPIAVGDTVHFAGQYAWNERGGVVHWTHHDPARHHPDGWLAIGADTVR